MDKKLKLLLYFLNFLAKKTKGQTITEDQYKKFAIDGGFKIFAENILILKFYNYVTFDGVKWENYIDEIKPLLSTFIDKIIAIKNRANPRDTFTDPIDDFFQLGGSSGDDNYIDFERGEIYIHFGSHNTNTFLRLLGLSRDDVHYYDSAEYHGDCYRPDDFSEDIYYVFGHLDIDNLEIIKKIVWLLGEPTLSDRILTTGENETGIIDSVIRTLKKVKGYSRSGEQLLVWMYEKYQEVTEAASCQSVIDAFKGHFRDTGIAYVDSNEFAIDYDTFIDFLKKHPEVQTFSDLNKGNYFFIEDECYASDAMYEYDNVDYEEMNREIYTLLNDFKDNIEDDEDVQKMIQAHKEFEKIMDDLGFEKVGSAYDKIIKGEKGAKHFRIGVDGIDYDNKKVILNFVDTSKKIKVTDTYKQSRYLIPFNEISDYVYTEKLYESLLNKIKKNI